MGQIHLRGKWRPRTPRWYNAALTHTKWMGNPSSPTLSSNCENRRAFFLPNQPRDACVRCISTHLNCFYALKSTKEPGRRQKPSPVLLATLLSRWTTLKHTCQPSRSRRDSPGLETETRRPARRPKKADSSRFVPINAPKHDFKPNFCLFSLFFSRNSSFFCAFWPFLMYPSVVNSYPNKKSAYIRALFILLFSERKKIGYILGLLFLAVNV